MKKQTTTTTTPCACDAPADILYFKDTPEGRVDVIRCMECGETWNAKGK